MGSCTYILSQDGCNDALIVDCGDVEPIKEYLGENQLILNGILLTHTHFDHIYGLNDLVALYPNCTVYTSDMGKIGLYDIRLNFSRYHVDQLPFIYQYENVELVEEGSEIAFGNTNIKVFYTPGHEWSCCSYIVDDCLFTGDAYIPGYDVRTQFPESNKEDAVISNQRLLDLGKKYKIYSGHPTVHL